MITALKRIFAPEPLRACAHEAYVRIVAQARQPVFYAQWQVDDTLDGRFDIIVLHLALLIVRCEQEGAPQVQSFVRMLSEVFFADMDRSLREMGAGDTGVGIRVKNMAQAFYGRLKAYEQALGDDVALREALQRNVYREKPVSDEALAALAAYAGQQYQALQSQPVADLLQGRMVFL